MTAESDDAAIRDLVRRANAGDPYTESTDLAASLADIMRRADLGPAAALPGVEVVVRATQGDEDAWNELTRRYTPLVWSVCRQFKLRAGECEDVAQSVWLRLVEELAKLREPAALPGWLVTVTRRECLRYREHSRRRHQDELDVEAVITHGRFTPTDTAVATAEEDVLRAAFSRLQPRCQQLLVLLMQTPPLSYREIADRLDLSVGSIGPSRARCLDQLRRDPALRKWIGLPE